MESNTASSSAVVRRARLVGLLLMVAAASVDASIWSYVQTHGFAGKAYEELPTHPNNNYDEDMPAELTENRPTWKPCRSDRACGDAEFCDRHYGFCDVKQELGAPCRRDEHCLETMECVFGRCREQIPLPETGARCRHDRQCGPAQCCAKHHGEKVCKRRLSVGASCYVPRGGMAYSLNEVCPCEHGAVCQVDESRLRELSEVRRWDHIEAMRCLPP